MSALGGEVSRRNELRQEADFFHRKIFGSPVSERTAEHYVRVHSIMLREMSDRQRIAIRTVVALGLDVEAIEFILKRKDPLHPLRKKLQILVYLCEADSVHYEDFVNERSRQGQAFASLAFYGMLTILKFMRGVYLVRRHRLV